MTTAAPPSTTPTLARRAGWLLLLLGASACLTAGGGEPELRARASFDLNCPREALTLTQLQEANWGATTNHGAAYGVAGCGRRATYVNNVGAWVLNSETGAGPQPQPQSQPQPVQQPQQPQPVQQPQQPQHL